MESFFSNWSLFLIIAGAIIAGIIALWGIFDQRAKQRRKELDDQEDRLINLYKAEIDQLKKNQEESEIQLNKLNEKYEREIKELRDKVVKVNGENEILKALLEGKDKNTLEFQKQGFDAMKRMQRMEKTTMTGFRTMNTNIERLARSIEKHLSTQESILSNK